MPSPRCAASDKLHRELQGELVGATCRGPEHVNGDEQLCARAHEQPAWEGGWGGKGARIVAPHETDEQGLAQCAAHSPCNLGAGVAAAATTPPTVAHQLLATCDIRDSEHKVWR